MLASDFYFFSGIEEIVVLNHELMSAIYHGEPRAMALRHMDQSLRTPSSRSGVVGGGSGVGEGACLTLRRWLTSSVNAGLALYIPREEGSWLVEGS